MSGRFIASAAAVARPVGERPSSRTPSQRKCSDHESAPRVEQHHIGAGLWIDCTSPRALPEGASDASESEVVLVRRATGGPRDHMVDVERGLLADLGQPAVLAPVLRALGHE